MEAKQKPMRWKKEGADSIREADLLIHALGVLLDGPSAGAFVKVSPMTGGVEIMLGPAMTMAQTVCDEFVKSRNLANEMQVQP